MSARHEHLPIVGYVDPLSAAPGETLRFMVSTTSSRYRAGIVRLFHGDPKPGGPGLKVREVVTSVDGEYPGRVQELRLGSCLVVDDGVPVPTDGAFTVLAWLMPTTVGRALQGLVTGWDAGAGRGWGLFLEPEGDLSLRLDGQVARTDVPLRPFAWHLVAAAYDPAAGRARLVQRPLPGLPLDGAVADVERSIAPPRPGPPTPLVIGGHVDADGRAVGRLNGKLDGPRIYARALTAEELLAVVADGPPPPAVAAAWDLRPRPGADDVVPDRGPLRADARVVNAPMRAVTGHRWCGHETDFRQVPDQYDAIFFHEDDLDDARWEPAFELAVPDDLPSGVYAARLTVDGGEDWVPFFVAPPRGTATAPVAWLAPTLSYLAYANEHAAIDNPAAVVDFDLRDYLQPEDRYAMAVPLVGLYDHHPDGTGVCYSSSRRPIVNMRPHYHLPLVRSAHQFPADLHLVDWLHEKGFRHDVVTDHDLDAEGAALLDRYRVVLTGSHPEYWTERMLDALAAYLGRGGRVLYLGGNGFYWVTSVDPLRPQLIEVRRGRRGTGTWRSEPGEDHHSTTGEPGGLWRDRGRAPQRLVGVGMTTQGFDRALPYRREAGSRDPRGAWVFDGVDEDLPIGDGGLVMGGAAGLELDRVDHRLGTPPHALVLASATGFSDSYQHVIEEVPSSNSRQGGSVNPYVRADMVLFETPEGGAVFSTGSIAWCGSLCQDGYDGPVSRITENVLRRFTRDENS